MENQDEEQMDKTFTSQQVNESQNVDDIGVHQSLHGDDQDHEENYSGEEEGGYGYGYGQDQNEMGNEEGDYMDDEEEGADNEEIEFEGEENEEGDEGLSHEYEGEEEQSGINSQVNQSQQQDESGQGQSQSQIQQDEEENGEEGIDGEYNQDGEDETVREGETALPTERKVRYKLFKFINKMRQTYRIGDYNIDRIANFVAMEYANYLLINKESDEELKNLAKTFNLTGDFKASSFEAFVDSDRANKNQPLKYTDYITDFYDVHATLIEFEQHRDNILSSDFNSVGIGLAYNEMKVVVVDIFCHREVIIDSCQINERNGVISVKGKIINEQYGVYALRIVKGDDLSKEIIKVTPQNIIPFNRENKIREFSATFNDGNKILGDPEPKLVEVYIRVKPESIPYGKAFTSKIMFDQLVFGARVPLENYPSDRQLSEQRQQDNIDESRLADERRIIAEYETAKKEEKSRRMILDSELYGKDDTDKLNNIIEEQNEDESISEISPNDQGGKKKDSSKLNDSKLSDAVDDNTNREKSEHYEQELNNLKEHIVKLKDENERIQKKIKAIYIIKKEEGREERNFFKESNINESTYADSLSSTAGLYNDLNSHKTKLEQDLKRYQESIKDQERRKEDVYTILMDYKTGLLENAETKKGTLLSRQQIDIWLTKEKDLENEIRDLRIESFTKSLEMNRLKKELKKMEDYFEGLHIIDFEQLKIENNTLTEKIEDRNEEIHKLKNKINYTVQILAHLQEKYKDISSENEMKKKDCDEMKDRIYSMKRDLTKNKELNDHKTLKQLNENKKIDQINSVPLKNYYKNTLRKITDLAQEIEVVSKQLAVYRRKRGGNVKDIKELLLRKERMIKDYKTLPHIDVDEKTK